MPSLTHRLELLQRTFGATGGDAIFFAIRHASASEREVLCTALAGSGDRRILARLIEGAPEIGPDAIRALAGAGEALGEPLRALIGQADALDMSTLATVGQVLRAWEHPASLELASEGVARAHERAGEVLGEALLACTSRELGPLGRRTPEPSRVAALDELFARVLVRHDIHRSRAALLAVALLLRHAGPVLRETVESASDAALMALRSAAGRASAILSPACPIDWLIIPPLAATALRRLAADASSHQANEAWRAAYLLRVPARRHALRGMAHPFSCLPSPSATLRADAAIQRGVVDGIQALDLTEETRDARLAAMVEAARASVRLSAARGLARRESTTARARLRSFCFDASASIADLAVSRLLPHDADNAAELAMLLSRSPHRSVRLLAANHAAAMGHAVSLAGLTCLGRSALVAFERQRAQDDRDQVVRGWGARLNGAAMGGGEERIATIRFIVRLGIAADLGEELIVLGSALDHRVAASAVLALGACPGERARDALHAALRHADGRVRANAVEALAKRDEPDTLDLIEPLVHSRHPRQRANAIVALMRFIAHHPAVLHAMLTDPDPRHRASARWAASRQGIRVIQENRIGTSNAAHERCAVAQRASDREGRP